MSKILLEYPIILSNRFEDDLNELTSKSLLVHFLMCITGMKFLEDLRDFSELLFRFKIIEEMLNIKKDKFYSQELIHCQLNDEVIDFTLKDLYFHLHVSTPENSNYSKEKFLEAPLNLFASEIMLRTINKNKSGSAPIITLKDFSAFDIFERPNIKSMQATSEQILFADNWSMESLIKL